MTSANSPPKLLTLIMLTGLSVLSLNMFLPSLNNIAATLQADYALVNISISGFMAVTAILQLIIGPLSDRYGRRPVLLAALAIFSIASLGCLLATDIWVFLFFRLLQSVITAGWIVSFAIVRDTTSQQKTASLIGYISMAMAIAPMLGPMLGGVLDDVFGWRASFFVFSVLGIVIFALCWFDVGETNKIRSATFAKQFRTYPTLLQSPTYWGYALCLAFSTGAFFSFIAGAPLVTKTLFSMSPTLLGFCIGSITAGFMLGSFISGRVAERYSLTTMMIAGQSIACISLVLGLLLFVTGFIHVIILLSTTIFVGLGNGIAKPSSNAGAMSVQPQLAGSAAGLAGALTSASGALITSLTAIVLTAYNGGIALLGMMLFCTAIALAAAFFVRWVDRRPGNDLQEATHN